MPDNYDWESEHDNDLNDDNEISADELRYAPVDDSESIESDVATESDDVEDSNEVERLFEDLTLAEMIGQFLHSPRQTGRALQMVTRASRTLPHTSLMSISTPNPVRTSQQITSSSAGFDVETMHIPTLFYERVVTTFTTKLTPKQVQMMLYLIAVVVGLIGSSLLLGTPDARRTEDNALVVGAPFLWLAFSLWLGAELYGNWQSLVSWWTRLDRLTKMRWVMRIIPVFVWLTALLLFADSMAAPAEITLGLVQAGIGRMFIGLIVWVLIEVAVWIFRNSSSIMSEAMSDGIKPVLDDPRYKNSRTPISDSIRQYITLNRAILFIGASMSSVLVWLGTPNNQIPLPIIILWLVSAMLWSMAFAPINSSFFDWATGKVDAFRRIDWRANAWVVVAFALIMILGMGFRLVELDTLPSEMTSDHVEKILDSKRVFNGEYNIFFANNGGREPIQMYLMSVFTTLPGLDFNHYTLKLLAALESLITLPILVWMGAELMGERNRRLGIIVGLMLAGLVGVSYWHVAITRQALRIVMTPIVTALLMIYLSRAIRHNRRSDYIKTALVLGFGLYAYQAVRMLPVVVVVGVAIALVIRSISWRERLAYGINLMVLVFISLMVFLPMLHYSTEDPGHFWKRTAGRILGDDVITEQLDDGTLVERKASVEEQTVAFNANVPILMTNVRNALLMFNWKGDVGWISGIPNDPAMDMFTGTFLILGLAAWAGMMLKTRDPVIWLIPIMIFIMLLPSALSIAYPLENPSHTRTSGAIPPVYLVAALPIALIVLQFIENLSKRLGLLLAVVFCGSVILLANHRNTSSYFNQYPPIYIESSYPYSEAGSTLRGFAESDGTFGNAFMIGYSHWWGHRAMGIAAGKPLWPNGIISRDDVPNFLNIAQLRSGEFQLDPEKDLLFFYSPADEATTLQLQKWFPDGREQEIQSYQPDDKYMLYRVPFLGEAGFREFLANSDD
jgi:hypothetical protein